jgi:hypothetical protein
MRIARSSVRSFLFTAATLALPIAASAQQPAAQAAIDHSSHGGNSSSALIDTVREVTAGFRFSTQVPDGFGQFLGCVSGPEAGAMGVHFVNMDNLNDLEIDVNKPEALIYEFKNGIGRLVGVEYLITVEDWNKKPRETPTPVLFGQVFHYNTAPNRFALKDFFELHVWAWRDNPNGAFVDWNPRVSCEGQ